MRDLSLALIALAAMLTGGAAMAGDLTVEGTQFVLATPVERLTSRDLVGAVFEIADGAGDRIEVRLDAVAPAAEQPSVLLHTLSVRDPRTGGWAPMCDPDVEGRRVGFPIRGRWDGSHFVADPSQWFLSCTSGSQGKCLLWGYDPWGKGPDGRPLADFYRACQQMVRADYVGEGRSHTRDGTPIAWADVAGVHPIAPGRLPDFAFEAGWGPDGAVCVARTRWPDLITRKALLAMKPGLGGRCDSKTAQERGALILTQIKTP